MSTRAVIARVSGNESEFKGVYSHWDGYPTNLGKRLWKIVHDEYQGDLAEALRFLIDSHTAGWSVAGEECYCHPKRKRDPEPLGNWFTHENTEKDIEWIYIFNEENNRLYIRDTSNDAEMIVKLSGEEPDWDKIECGENLERCSHYAWRHNLLPKTSNLSTSAHLSYRKMEFRDAVAFIIDGRRYVATGSGGNSDYLRKATGKNYPSNVWIATVQARNGRRLDLPVAYIARDGYTPYEGVTWVFPPTQNNPTETEVKS